MHWGVTGLIALTIMMPAALADMPSGAVAVSQAWVPATGKIRSDVPLSMTITNGGDVSDNLVRARCPTDLADFTDKHATDRGEGGTSMRGVKSFTIPAKGSLVLKPDGNHLMLLDIREPLQAGQTFACAIVFQTAGTITAEVTVIAGEAKTGP